MEFVTEEQKHVESNTDLNYAQFIKKTMKNVKEENITYDLELLLNTNFFKQYLLQLHIHSSCPHPFEKI